MRRVIRISVTCGDTTCAYSPGNFCSYVGSRIDGSATRCTLFNVPLKDKNGGITGWLLRCETCLALEEEQLSPEEAAQALTDPKALINILAERVDG